MFFNNKKPKKESCPDCGSNVDASHQFCAFCSFPLKNQAKEAKDYGLLGRYDSSEDSLTQQSATPGITDKIINSMISSVMKSFDKQFRDMEKDLEREIRKAPENAEIKQLPNGITIKFGNTPQALSSQKKKAAPRKKITEDQASRLTKLPRAQAKSSVKRLSDKVVYELATPGVQDPQDVFVSKVETGYEVKAIGTKKVYVNTLPIELPLRRLSLAQNKLLVEFNTQEQ
ncbi:hypothetical protein CMI48_04270 [Candidatus Pacearchaeota archaeon]|jgi:hypothetical protein|nr:hypothetical protein [Candidatus Pacearchaeota archaeon]